MKKRRTNFNVTYQQFDALSQIAKEQQLSISELLRRIIDEWLERRAKQ